LSTCEGDDPIIDRSADVATRCVVALVEPRPRTRLSISKQSMRYNTRVRLMLPIFVRVETAKLEGICSSLRR